VSTVARRAFSHLTLVLARMIGQTKLKSVLVDYLVSAGIKPASIVSYNHLGTSRIIMNVWSQKVYN
jgi:hypothetical protein